MIHCVQRVFNILFATLFRVKCNFFVGNEIPNAQRMKILPTIYESQQNASFFRILYQKTFSFFVVMLHNSSPNFGSSITSKILSRRRKIYEAERQPSIGLLALSFCAMHNFIDKMLVAKTAKANSSERNSPQKSYLNFYTKNYICFFMFISKNH